MSEVICRVDDKHVPLYRIVWISDVPHFCGEEDCTKEGRYEIRLEYGESVFASRDDRDATLQQLENWGSGPKDDQDSW